VVGVAEFDVEVGLPATIERSVGDAVRIEFISERDACAT
jgi:hypothetical protein